MSMNRLIEFRGLTSDSGWVYGSFDEFSKLKKEFTDNYEYGTYNSHITMKYFHRQVIRSTVGQFTGAFTGDKYDKIYEGDVCIISEDYHGFRVTIAGVVEFKLGKWVVGDRDLFNGIDHWVNWEIVGNIHESPSLLNYINEIEKDECN